MPITVRDLLEELDISSTKRLCSARNLPSGGTQHDRISTLARSFRGDHEALLVGLTKEQLVRVLSPVWLTDDDRGYMFTNLAPANKAELLELARRMCTEWEPTEDGERPVRSANISVLFDSDGGGESSDDGDAEFAADDDFEEDDVDERDFRDSSYADEIEKEFRYASEHRGGERAYQQEAAGRLLADISADQPQLLHVATGGGKTRIANDVVTGFLEQGVGPVLWMTKDWRLLLQAARDRCRRVPGAFEHIGRLGGDGSVLHPVPERSSVSVLYTTLQTLGRGDRLNAFSRRDRPRLVVWDECHWGEHAKLGRRLLKWCARNRIPVIGLTATPRAPDESRFRVSYSIDYHTLVEQGFLAAANKVEPVQTNTRWEARRPNAFSDFQQDSLRELGSNEKRNKVIVDHYQANAGRYQQTIVFACSIAHAEALAERFNRDHGIAARPVHSGRGNVDNEDALRKFERSEIQVLVNVAKLTMGHDFPAARAVFLCRPTLSEILFAQMIGRAARLHAPTGKTQFDIVEFTDNLSQFGDQLVTAKKFFKGAAETHIRTEEPKPVPPPTEPRLTRHAFDLRGAATWLGDDATLPEAARGLWYRQGQTFGVEVELTSDDFDPEMQTAAWLPRAEALRKLLAEELGPELVAAQPLPEHGSDEKDHGVWNVEWDGSAGWEVTSRVLRGQGGYLEIDKVCTILARAGEQLGLRVNAKTGVHVHLGWLGRSANEVKRAIQLARLFEPALATLVSPSRIADFDGHRYNLDRPNEYCKPVSSVIPLQRLRAIETFDDLWSITRAHKARYVTFNIKPLDEIQTVEVRLFNGTTESRKILVWLSLWQQILWAASNEAEIPEVPDSTVIRPDGDVVALAMKHLPSDRGRMLVSLHERRLEVRRLWEKRPEFSAWLELSAAWTAPAPRAPDPVEAPALYFAFGANMSADVMGARCRSARAVGVGKLLGFRLAFAGSSTRWGGSVATVIAEEGRHVDGVLYELPVSELEMLDHAEGKKYERMPSSIDTGQGLRAANIYTMPADAAPGIPSRDYLRVLRAEYQRLGFDVLGLLDAITA